MSSTEDKQNIILIVDHDKEIRSVVFKAIIEEFPNSLVIESGDGADAAIRVQRQVFDLVITELDLPKMKGIDFIQMMSGIESRLRPKSVLIISSEVFPEKLKKLKSWISYLQKPCSTKTICEKARHLMNPELDDQKNNPKLEVTILNPFLKAVNYVMQYTASLPIPRGQVFIRKEDEVSGDISAVVSISSSLIAGSVTISFENLCFLEIVNNMLSEEHKEINSSIANAASEICNQVFALARKELNEQGNDIQPALPILIIGNQHQVKHVVSTPVIGMQYTTSKGKFKIEICVWNKVK